MVPVPLQSRNGAITSYFKYELRLLRMFGVSLYKNEALPYRIYSFFIIFFGTVLYSVLHGYELSKHNLNDGIGEIVMFETALIMQTLKICVVLLNKDKIIKLFAQLEEKPFLPNPERGGDAERKLVEQSLWITKAQRLTMWTFPYVVFFGLASNTVFQRLTSNDWNFPFGALTVWNVTYSPNYEITVLYQYFSIFCVAGVSNTIDLLLIGVLVHVAYQFKILQNYIRQLVDVAGRKMIRNTPQRSNSIGQPTNASVISWEYLEKCIKKAVRYHLAILDLNQEVENIFSLLLLAQLLSITIQLCFTIYVSTIGTNNTQVAKNAALFFFASLQAFLVSYWAQEVFQESQQVGQAAYESNFVGTDIRFQKCLILIMCRSQRPWKITAGKFAVISLATFVWILRTSYSSFTVIQTVNTK